MELPRWGGEDSHKKERKRNPQEQERERKSFSITKIHKIITQFQYERRHRLVSPSWFSGIFGVEFRNR